VVRPGELFDDDRMAAGYASDRPAVHPHLVDRLRAAVPERARVAVDVGCGAGASTTALRPIADIVLGIDPAEPMVEAARRAVPDARFAVAAAEALPFAAGSIGLLAAAGALNFADLDAFVPGASRVLADDGLLAVMDYGFGRPADAAVGAGWPARFAARWPRPAAGRVDAAAFARTSFRVVTDARFVVSLPMTRDAYVAYLLTDTAVAAAVAEGTAPDAIRTWCEDALAGFGAEGPVAFDATLLVLSRRRREDPGAG
jgi:SAM-dependent methyltransferase